jgi:hypothetical protein
VGRRQVIIDELDDVEHLADDARIRQMSLSAKYALMWLDLVGDFRPKPNDVHFKCSDAIERLESQT